jgi:TonB family protein
MRAPHLLMTIASVATVLGAPAVATTAVQPTGPWRVSYDVAQCVAHRDYGTPDKPVELVLKPSPKGSVMRIFVLRKGGTAELEQLPATLWFGDQRDYTNLLHYRDEQTGFGIAAINVPMALFKANMSAPYVRIESRGPDAAFALSQLPGVVAELDKCVADLREFWNIGAAYKSRITTPATPKQSLHDLFTGRDYPLVAIHDNEQGAVALTFLVDEHGGVSDCTVDETSGIPVLDTMSCYVISSRARFTPALGPDGKPVRSAYSERIVWRISP